MLTKSEIMEFLSSRHDEMKTLFSVRRIGLFGSYLNEDAGEESDVDIVVEFDMPSFDHYMDLKFYLESHFRKKVDLVIADTIKPRLRPIISQQVMYA
jgi:predicted nucleotidyltransferase